MTSPIQPIRVESILVDGRLRKLRENVVAELVESIRQVGLIHPILIRRPDNHLVPHLVAGWHRLEAVRRLGWQEVPCCTLESDDVQAELNEIDENLARADLTPAERAAHVGRRKELHEAAHPETRRGGAPGKAGGGKKKAKSAKLASFADDNARKTGRGSRSVQRDATRAKRIPRIADVAGTSLDQGEELDALAKLPVQWQAVLIERAVAGEVVTAKAPPEPEPEPEPEPAEPYGWDDAEEVRERWPLISDMARAHPGLTAFLLGMTMSVLAEHTDPDHAELAEWALEECARYVEEKPRLYREGAPANQAHFAETMRLVAKSIAS